MIKKEDFLGTSLVSLQSNQLWKISLSIIGVVGLDDMRCLPLSAWVVHNSPIGGVYLFDLGSGSGMCSEVPSTGLKCGDGVGCGFSRQVLGGSSWGFPIF